MLCWEDQGGQCSLSERDSVYLELNWMNESWGHVSLKQRTCMWFYSSFTKKRVYKLEVYESREQNINSVRLFWSMTEESHKLMGIYMIHKGAYKWEWMCCVRDLCMSVIFFPTAVSIIKKCEVLRRVFHSIRVCKVLERLRWTIITIIYIKKKKNSKYLFSLRCLTLFVFSVCWL